MLPSDVTEPIPFMPILLITSKNTWRRFIYLIKEGIYGGNDENQPQNKSLAQSMEVMSKLSYSNKMLSRQHFVI